MQNYHILKEVDIKDTFKNDVLKGIFEIDMQKIITEKNHTLHFDEFDFNIGCIIGTSGSGKTQLAREISIQNNIPLIEKNTWNDDSLISNFDCEVKEAVLLEEDKFENPEESVIEIDETVESKNDSAVEVFKDAIGLEE